MKALWRMIRSTDDVASCMEVIRKLDAYLDGEIRDELTARRIAAHPEACRRCGLEAQTLIDLKAGLRRLAPRVDPATVDRLRRCARGLEREHADKRQPRANVSRRRDGRGRDR